jgi:hypothetical protein
MAWAATRRVMQAQIVESIWTEPREEGVRRCERRSS